MRLVKRDHVLQSALVAVHVVSRVVVVQVVSGEVVVQATNLLDKTKGEGDGVQVE